VSPNKAITPGNTLQNLKYNFNQGQRQKLLLMLLTVFLPYVVTKITEYIARENWSDPNLFKHRERPPTLIKQLKYMLARLF
jgi:hypothetical protein